MNKSFTHIFQIIIVYLITIYFFNISYAEEFGEEKLILGCALTPEIWDISPPPKSLQSNNLRRRTGSPYFASGEFINITGQVLDINCIPIPGATVRIWQADSNGVSLHPFIINENYKPDDSKIREEESIAQNTDIHFAESGTNVTDNLGRFSFFTIMPGRLPNRAPYIHFSISHHKFPYIETEMFFPDQAANDKDIVLTSHVAHEKKHLLISQYVGYNKNDDSDIYEFNVVLPGTLDYKQY